MEIFYETDSELRADEVGAILSSTEKAFSQFTRRRYRTPLSLTVTQIRVGSLSIVLEVFGIAELAWDQKDILSAFATHLVDLVRLTDYESFGAPRRAATVAEKKALETIARPVADGHARQVNIVNYGIVVVSLDQSKAARLIERLDSDRRPEKVLLPEVFAPQLVDAEMTALTSGTADGTALNVEGAWYARLVGGQGVLIPLYASPAVAETLHHNAIYRFDGTILHDVTGHSVGITIRAAQRMPLAGKT